ALFPKEVALCGFSGPSFHGEHTAGSPEAECQGGLYGMGAPSLEIQGDRKAGGSRGARTTALLQDQAAVRQGRTGAPLPAHREFRRSLRTISPLADICRLSYRSNISLAK